MYSSSSQIPFFPNIRQPQSSFNQNFDQPETCLPSKATWDEYFLSKFPQQTFTEHFFNNGGGIHQTPFSRSPPSFGTAVDPLSKMSQQSLIKFEKDFTQRIFFRTLLSSIKQISHFLNIKIPSWKNPFLYKTSLCSHWRIHGYCRFGDNCWYAHGLVDLRYFCMSEIPTPEYISQFLVHLGLPQHVLNEIIFNAYFAAGFEPRNELILPPEDPVSSQHSCENVTTSTTKSSFDSFPLHHHQQKPIESFNNFQPSWIENLHASAPTEETTTINSLKTFSLFGDSYPSAFISTRH